MTVQYHTHTEAPAQIDEYQVLAGIFSKMHILSESHRAGVVVHRYGNSELLGECCRERNVLRYEISQAVALFGVHAARQADAHSEYLVPVDADAADLFLDAGAHILDGLFARFEDKFYILDEVYDFTLEVAHSHMEMMPGDIDSHEITGFGIETVNDRSAATGSTEFALVLQEAFFYQFSYEFGDGRNADSQTVAEVRYAVRVVLYAEPDYLSFGLSIFAALVVKEGSTHIKCNKSYKSNDYFPYICHNFENF